MAFFLELANSQSALFFSFKYGLKDGFMTMPASRHFSLIKWTNYFLFCLLKLIPNSGELLSSNIFPSKWQKGHWRVFLFSTTTTVIERFPGLFFFSKNPHQRVHFSYLSKPPSSAKRMRAQWRTIICLSVNQIGWKVEALEISYFLQWRRDKILISALKFF